PNHDKILCIGLNYASHVGEVGRQLPTVPSVFSRLHNTLVPNGGNIVRPAASTNFDFEGELAVIIGERCRHVPRARALSVIAGYSCFLDVSVRDFQKHSVTAGKNFPATGPLGPWMVTTDILPDPQKLTLVTRLNGAEVQRDTTDHMIFDVATIIEYLSTVTWLEPGDVIATGTPDGVGLGRKPPLWMKGGDKLEVEISGIGALQVNVVDE
ncbi:MAG: fumarylacetoacetate hydrolase family protein, partial [Reyranellales bacterium]